MDRMIQRKGVNHLLRELYGEERLLSQIITNKGLNSDEIQQIRSRMDLYLDNLLDQWTVWCKTILPERRWDIIVRRFGLDGMPISTLEALGNQYGVSRERIRQLQKNTLRRLRSKKRLEYFEELVVTEARRLLNR